MANYEGDGISYLRTELTGWGGVVNNSLVGVFWYRTGCGGVSYKTGFGDVLVQNSTTGVSWYRTR